MKNEIEFFGTNQKDAFMSLSNKIISNYNSLGGNMPMIKKGEYMPKSTSALSHLIAKISTIIFDRGDPISVPTFLKRVATGKAKGLGKPDGDAFANLEDTFLGFGHFRESNKTYTLNEKELKAVQMYLRGQNTDVATTEFKYKGLIISARLHKSGVKFPNDKTSDLLHNQFKVSITNEATGDTTSFDYYGSYNDYKEFITTIEGQDLLYAFEAFISDAIAGNDEFENFCSEFGYDTDSRAAERIHKECIKSLAKAQSIIDGDLYEFYNDLQEVTNN